MSRAIAVERGCGTRQEGGVYAEVGVGENGLPLEHFILDPPVLLSEDLGVSAIGVTLVPETTPTGTVWHIADWIGINNYPNVWDFLGEARNFGVSRRIPKTLDFSKLSSRSRLLCIHKRAAILNSTLYTGNKPERFGEWAMPGEQSPLCANPPFGAKWRPGQPLYGGWKCPKCLVVHEPTHDPDPCCAGVWAQDIEGGEELSSEQRDEYANVNFRGGQSIREGIVAATVAGIDGTQYRPDDPRLVLRVMPSFRYIGRRPPENVEPVYHAAFFASFPISRLVVVAGHGDSEALTKANASNLTVNIVKE